MSHAAGHFFIFFTYFPTYIYGEEQHFATLSANTRYESYPGFSVGNFGHRPHRDLEYKYSVQFEGYILHQVK